MLYQMKNMINYNYDYNVVYYDLYDNMNIIPFDKIDKFFRNIQNNLQFLSRLYAYSFLLHIFAKSAV